MLNTYTYDKCIQILSVLIYVRIHASWVPYLPTFNLMLLATAAFVRLLGKKITAEFLEWLWFNPFER